MRRIFVLVCCGAAIAGAGIYFLTGPGKDRVGETRAEAAPTDDPLWKSVNRLERELETELQLRNRGLTTEWDVDHYRVGLAKARHNAALMRGDREEMGHQLRVLIEVRERYWKRMAPGIEHGTASPIEVEDARRLLAVARYRFAAFEGRRAEADEQFRLVATTADRRVERLVQASARQAAPPGDLNRARYVAGCVRYVRAQDSGRAEDVRAEIDRSVALWEAEVERVSRMHARGAASGDEHRQARHILATVRLRRATLDQDRASAANQLRAKIQVDDEFLAGLTPTDPVLRRLRSWFEWDRDYDKYCLVRLERDGIFPADSAAGDLDW
jgi:hypothetical protein